MWKLGILEKFTMPIDLYLKAIDCMPLFMEKCPMTIDCHCGAIDFLDVFLKNKMIWQSIIILSQLINCLKNMIILKVIR